MNKIKYKLDESQIDWIINKPKSLYEIAFNIEYIFLKKIMKLNDISFIKKKDLPLLQPLFYILVCDLFITYFYVYELLKYQFRIK